MLLDAEGREVRVPLASIDEQKGAGSLMPAGLVDGLTRAEVVDLVRFLSELGKLGPYAVRPELRLARRWEAARSASTSASTLPRKAIVDDRSGEWVATYSTVAGVVPLSDLPVIAAAEGRLTLVRTTIDVTAPGLIRLAITPRTASVWVDGDVVPGPGPSVSGSDLEVDVNLKAGSHAVTLAVPVDAGAGPSVRLEIRDVQGSPAQARPSLGK